MAGAAVIDRAAQEASFCQQERERSSFRESAKKISPDVRLAKSSFSARHSSFIQKAECSLFLLISRVTLTGENAEKRPSFLYRLLRGRRFQAIGSPAVALSINGSQMSRNSTRHYCCGFCDNQSTGLLKGFFNSGLLLPLSSYGLATVRQVRFAERDGQERPNGMRFCTG